MSCFHGLIHFVLTFARGITERVWISLSCKPLSEPCKWGDGELLGWSEWRTAQEPMYECGVLDYYNSGFPNWISRKCPDRYRSLCTGKYIYLLFIYSVNSNFNIHTCISFVYRIKQRMPHYRNSSKRIKQRMPHYRNSSKRINQRIPHYRNSSKRIKQRMPHYRNSSKRIKQRMPHYRNSSKRIKQRMPHYRNSSKRIKQRMPHYRNISKIQWNNGRKR
jgi:hypothetical protein